MKDRKIWRGEWPAQALVVLVLLAGLTAGCQPEPVRMNVMPLAETGLVASPVYVRMLAAVAERGGGTWFFKLTGPPSRVAAANDSVRTFLQQLRFDAAGEPVLELPAGWTMHRRNRERFVTVVVTAGEGDPLELSVTRLGPGQDLRANVNRWRRQLSLEPVPEDGLEAIIERMESAGGELILFDGTGPWNESAAMPPMAGGRGGSVMAPGREFLSAPVVDPSAGGESRPRPSAVAGPLPDLPGWVRDAASSLVVGAYHLEEDGRRVRLAVSELPASLNSWENSVRNWIGEAGLGDWTDAQVESSIQALEVCGRPARRVDLVPSAGDRGVIGVRIECGERAVYIKLTGDRALVEREAGRVAELCEQLRLREVAGPEPDREPGAGAGNDGAGNDGAGRPQVGEESGGGL